MSETASEEDILRYLKENGPTQRNIIVKYMIKDIAEEGITAVSVRNVDTKLKSLKDRKKVRSLNGVYYIIKKRAAKKEKKKADDAELPKNQDADAIQDKEAEPTPGFSERVEKDRNLAKSLQGTAFLLDATLLLLDKIRPSDHSHKTVISEKKEKCKAHLASVNKISEKFAHLVVQRENQYGAIVRKAQESYKERHRHGMIMEGYNAAAFRDAFSDVILQIREECARMCFASPATHEEGAVNDSCRLALIALNETCRNDYNVVVNSYEYDEVQGVFKIDLSELKRTPYEISQVYLDGKNRTFGIVGGKEQIPQHPDRTIEFYPGVEISDESKHTLTIRVQCAEFSFEIAGKHRPRRIHFLDHKKDDIEMIDFGGRRGESDIVMLKPQMGGKIQDVIESHSGEEFSCPCGKTHPCNGWIGRLHGNGTPDKSGTRYWMMIRCSDSDRMLSLRYILGSIVSE